MEKQTIEQQVIKVIVDYFEMYNPGMHNPDEIKRDSLVNDIMTDSLDKVSVIMEIEKFFGISISEEEIESLETIGDLVDLVEKYVN